MNIVAIGEILFDIYPTKKKLGGAPLNYIYHINKILGSGTIVSRVGKDPLGQKVFEELKKFNISTEFIQQDNMHPTGVANVTLDADGNPEFEIDTERAFDYIEKTPELNELMSSDLDCFYFGTLAQRSEVSRNTIQSFFSKKGVKYFLDLNLRNSFYDEEILIKSLETSDVLKVNYKEMIELNDLIVQINYNTEKVAYELMDRFNISLIAVTRGKDGATLFENGKRYDYANSPRKILDCTGAGDAFSAILSIGFMLGIEPFRINKLANDFALEVCMIEGALLKDEIVYENLKNELGLY
ncbi:MAG: carbohydrate kinase [Ignavibacterium sp.]|nr:carbohydrate kinase [Ignavibacterium sp.]MDW8375673.1 carbohydrate kinase [Ignavibacteriales bacterium]